ncbi:MAG: site-specific integrase [Clostridia bacterium]|nr:site-specific integrase [Clostridia bacterium]
MATITKRGNTYRIRVSCGYDASGRQIVRSMTYTPPENITPRGLQKELNRIAVEFEIKVQSGNYVDASNIRFADFCDKYLEMAKTTLSPNTLAFAHYVVEQMIKPMLGHMKLQDIRPLHVQQFINALAKDGARADGKGSRLSPATIKRDFTVLKSIMAKAYKLGLIDRNPTETARLDLPEVVEKEVEIFTKEEAAHMLACLDDEPLAFQVLIHLALVTGARRGELVALKWDCIDLIRKTLAIKQSSYKLKGEETRNKAPKTRGSVRTVALPEYLIAMLRDYRAWQLKEQMRLGDCWRGEGYLFTQWNGKQMNPQTPTRQFTKFLARHGIPHRKFHALRHTSATLLLASGTNIKTVAARLGHTQLSTTNRYVHALRDADQAAADTFSALLSPEEKKQAE